MLDLCRAHSGQITPQVVSQAAGLVGQEHLFQIAGAVAKGDLSQALELIARAGEGSVEYDRLCSQLVSHFRNLLMILSSKKPEQLIICLPETLEQYRAQAKDFSAGRLIPGRVRWTAGRKGAVGPALPGPPGRGPASFGRGGAPKPPAPRSPAPGTASAPTTAPPRRSRKPPRRPRWRTSSSVPRHCKNHSFSFCSSGAKQNSTSIVNSSGSRQRSSGSGGAPLCR